MGRLISRVKPVQVRRGETLYQQGDTGNCLHVVLTGRLQVRVSDTDGRVRNVAYPQPGDVVGEIALLSGLGRSATIVAVRDTMLGAITRSDIDELIAETPQVLTNIAHMIITRLTGNSGHISRRTGARTLMIVTLHPTSENLRIIRALVQQLLRFGSVLHLDAVTAKKQFGYADLDAYGSHLDACENTYDFLLLEADSIPSAWNRVCRGYADKIVLLADSTMESSVTELERWLFFDKEIETIHAETELVLVHPRGRLPIGTREWLSIRQVVRHHHILADNSLDIARLSRFLSGNALALVLAGGGARGFAHLGVVRALHEAGITVDAVGGASFGALAATGLARGMGDADSFFEQQTVFTCEDPLGDYTLPVMSLVRGEHLNMVLRKHLPMDIEDLWIPFFAVSSDLSANQVRIHDRGPLWKAIRASVSLPAILPPTLDDGHLLVDGGVLNNLPIDIMRERISGPIIAVDLAVDTIQGTNHQRIPSGYEYVKNFITTGRKSIDAPTLSRVILQVTTMASRKEVQSARKLANLYLNPALSNFDFLDWDSMHEIADAGYRHALPRINSWLETHPSHVDRAYFLHQWKARKAA